MRIERNRYFPEVFPQSYYPRHLGKKTNLGKEVHITNFILLERAENPCKHEKQISFKTQNKSNLKP